MSNRVGDLEIRLAQASDRDAIRDLVYAAFQNHPHHRPGTSPTEHLIAEKLAADDALTVSLVAVERDRSMGYLAVSPVKVEGVSQNWFGIGPVAVTPRRQNHGIGSALVRQSIEHLRQDGAAGLVVLGEPRFYQRFGFQVMPGLTLAGIPPAYFMALLLNGPMARGAVTYHAALS